MLLAPSLRGFARHLFRVCLALAATGSAIAQSTGITPSDGFDPNIDGNVYGLVSLGDGQILAVGQFASAAPNGGEAIERSNIARFKPDGSFDLYFHPDINGAIRAVVVQPNGKMIIGGDFTKVNGTDRMYIARLNTDGTLDTTFNAGVTTSTSLPTTPQVLALALQSDGSVVVGGSFGSVTSGNGSSAVTVERRNLARFTASGAVDSEFNPNPNGMVLSVALQSDGKILAGGGFTKFNENNSTVDTTRSHLARINTNGTVDAAFDPAPNNGVTTIALERDGRILVGGFFTQFTPNGGTTVGRNHIARLKTDGTIDTEFYPSVGGNISTIVLAPDGGIIVGGRFAQVWGRGGIGVSSAFVARFTADGTADGSFSPGVNAEVDAIATQPDGKVVLGGYFTRAQAPGMSAALTRNHIARVLPDGTLDAAFQFDEGGRILASVTQSDGRIVVAGSFTNYDGEIHNYIARLNANGTIDSSYKTQLNGAIYSLSIHTGNDANKDKIMIGGSFTQITTPGSLDTRNHIARLNADGTVDQSFTPSIDGIVGTIVEDKNGNFLVGGLFSTIAPTGETLVTARNNLLRLDSNGHLDAKFDPSPNTSVSSIGLQSDGKIVIVGTFTYLFPNAASAYFSRSFIARLNDDGSVDEGYTPNLNDVANSVVIQSDGKAVVGGRFQKVIPKGAIDSVDRNRLVRFNPDGTLDTAFNPNPNGMVIIAALQSDNKILIGGTFTSLQPEGDAAATTVRYAARLTSEGKVDTSFNLDLPEGTGQRVDSIAIQPSGDILIGGTFTSLAPQGSARVQQRHFARIKQSGARDVAFTPGPGSSSTAQVRAIAMQPDGRILVGGKFATIGGSASSNLARFNPEGSPDSTFNLAMSTDGDGVYSLAVRTAGATEQTQLGGFAWLNANGTLRSSFAPTISTQGTIRSTLVLSSGSILLAGNFSITNQTSGNIIKLSPAGVQDTSFSATISGTVSDMVAQANGDIIVVGSFNSVNGTTRNNIARLKSDGTLDTAFDPNASDSVAAVVLDTEGKIIIGGSFTTLTPNSATSATVRNFIARLNTDGTVDSTYDPNPNSTIYALAIDANGKLIVGGTFTTVQPNSATSTTTRNRIVRLEKSGELDTSFTSDVNNFVSAVAIDPVDQSIVIGGAFSQVNGIDHSGIARLGTDGAPSPTFTADTNSVVYALSITADRSIIAGGSFTTATSTDSTTPIARNRLVRFTSGGQVDLDFNPDLQNIVYRTTTLADGSLLVGGVFSTLQASGMTVVGGSFTQVGGVPRANLAQLNSDGSVNAVFHPDPNGVVKAIVARPNGGFIVGGAFTSLAGAARSGLAQFDDKGVLDSFAPDAGSVSAVALQADDKVLAGTSSGLVRFNTNGSRDATFTPAAPFFSAVAIAVQSDGRILVAGPGSGVPTRVVRLNADGSVDSSFATVNAEVQSIALQADGSILIAGSFTNLAGSGISRIARLSSAGIVDTSFSISANDAVSALAIQSDGRVFLGGKFTQVGGYDRIGIARVSNDRSATQALGASADGRTVTWIRRGSAGEVVAVSFEQSTDARSWTFLGSGTRVAGGSDWQLTNISLPTNGTTTYLRARGIAPSSAGVSSGVYEAVRQVNYTTTSAGTGVSIAPVVTSTPWDQTHYVWSLDSAGIFRIVDAYTSVSTNKTVLENGSVPITSPAAGGLADISTRAFVTPTAPLIGGFAITGTASRTVLIRAIGPGLAPFDVPTYLRVPKLQIYSIDGKFLAEKSGWDSSMAADFVRTGAFPLTPGSTDCALIMTLPPGNYTAHVTDPTANSTGGDTLVEVYDAGDLNDRSARVVNLSSRGTVTADKALIGGLVISGNTVKTILIRGVGPALKKFSVTSPLADPVVSVYEGTRLVVTNDNWQISKQAAVPGLDYGTAIAGAATNSGAFQFDSGSEDGALIVTLPSGAYTIQVTSADGGSGEAMIECYELQQ